MKILSTNPIDCFYVVTDLSWQTYGETFKEVAKNDVRCYEASWNKLQKEFDEKKLVIGFLVPARNAEHAREIVEVLVEDYIWKTPTV